MFVHYNDIPTICVEPSPWTPFRSTCFAERSYAAPVALSTARAWPLVYVRVSVCRVLSRPRQCVWGGKIRVEHGGVYGGVG